MSQLPNNITELIAALEGLGKRNLNDEYALFGTCRGVFEKLKRLSDFDPGDIKKIIKTLKDLPPEIKEQKIEELEAGGKKLETRALNKQDLKELIEDYEKAKSNAEREKIEIEIYQRTGQEDVKRFIEVQKEIALRNAEKINVLNLKLKTKITEDLALIRLAEEQEEARITEEAILINEQNIEREELNNELIKKDYDDKETARIIEKVSKIRNEIRKQKTTEKKKIIETLIQEEQKENENLVKIIEEASLENDQDYKREKINKELKKTIKDPEEVEYLTQKIDEIRAEIKVEEKAEEIATTTYKKLLEEKLPINSEIKEKIRNEILIAWREGDRLQVPENLSNMQEAGVIIAEAEKATDNYKNENIIAIVNYRSMELGKEISQDLRKNGVKNEKLIREYITVVNQLTNNPDDAMVEENRSDTYNFVKNENQNKSDGEIERSIDEAKFVATNVVKTPKKFKKLIQKYNVLREKIGSDKLPKIKEIRVLEKMTSLFQKSPKLLKLMNGTQKMVGAWHKVSDFTNKILSKIGVKEAGLKIVEKIGGQAAADFVKNTAAVIAKEGTVKGVGLILKSILGKGTVVAAEGTASGGALAGAVAAFQALPFAGQVIAVLAIVLIVVKPIIDTTKKILEKALGMSLNKIKKFVAEDLGLGKFVGSVSQLVFDLWVFLIGIPKLFGLIKFGASLTPIFIFFFAGTFLYNMLMHQQVSSIVPPTDLSGCILKRGTGPGGLPEGEINCDMNAPENEVPGLISKENYIKKNNQWTSGKNYAEECFNDVVNRSLCAGINPLYSLWAWMHESNASNYESGNLVQDFGINDNSIAENFDAQIKVFLNLDLASACDLNDSKLNGPDGYWLAWASRYLTGQCDPDFKHPDSGQTGRDYLESTDPENWGMKTTWTWIAGVPLPKDIYVEKGGQKCEQAGSPFSLTGPTKEIIGDDGQIYICSTGSNGTQGIINIIPGQAGTGGPVTQCPFGGFSHRGTWAMDFGVPNGTPIYSTFAGVAYVGEGNGYGVYVDVHSNIGGDEFFIRYAHMPPGGNKVSNGQTVAAGQQIGDSDNNGFSTGPHLHYEVVGANISWDNAGPYFGMTQEEFNSACR